MSSYFYEDYISEAEQKKRPLAKQNIMIGPDALHESAGVLNNSKYGKTWILSDENTESAAGKRFKRYLPSKEYTETVLPAEPMPIPYLETAEKFAEQVRQDDIGLIVSVGSGTLSDLGKHISFLSGIPNWCLATAPSVDAYTSPRSAIRVKGYHESLLTSPSELIICDLEVLTDAPEILFFSGAGDLLAKYFAYLDWNLSAILTGESIEKLEAEYALSSARRAIEACRNYRTKPTEAVEALTDAILTSGLVMQGIGHSRPAASAEHTVAHFWEMTGKIGNENLDRHGILVAIASRQYIDSYTAFYKILKNAAIDPGKRAREVEMEAPWQDKVDPVMEPYMAKMEMEMKEKEPDSGLLRKRLENFRKNEEKIFSLALPLLEELGRMGGILEDINFPFDPKALNFPDEMYNAGFTHVRYLRNRYSSIDFAADTGYEHVICPVK